MEFTRFWPTVSTHQQVYWTILYFFFYITHVHIVRNGRYALALTTNLQGRRKRSCRSMAENQKWAFVVVFLNFSAKKKDNLKQENVCKEP